jgi:hypothetical protein
MSSIKELASMFDRPAKTEEDKKLDKKMNNVHRMVHEYMGRTSPGSKTSSVHKENAQREPKGNVQPLGASAITEGFKPASPTSKPQFRLP